MNLKYRISLVVFCFMLVGCFTTDDSFGRSVSLTVQDSFSLENQKEYTVGDTIFFELRFSRYLPEEGFSELLDIYETTKAENFEFSFGFEKFSEFEGGFRQVFIGEDFIVAETENIDTYYFNNYGAVASLNEARDTYQARVGVILAEDGLFRFNFDNVFISPPFDYDAVRLNINHRFSTEGLLDTEFTVTE